MGVREYIYMFGERGAMIRYLEDFKASNIQDADKGDTLTLGPIERLVDSSHEPSEETLIDGL